MHCRDYLRTTAEIALVIDPVEVEALASMLYKVMGRIYVVGIGGSAANALHMAADLRKLCNLDAEAGPNVAEWTARANDEGLDTVFTGWLQHMTAKDALFVLSVGGGALGISEALIRAVDFARLKGSQVLGIVGPEGGHTARHGTCVIKVPAPKDSVTPHTEAFQAVLWHALVSHPLLQRTKTKW